MGGNIMNTYWSDAVAEIKNVKSMVGAGMMTALDVVLDFFRIVISNILEIGFSFLAIAVAGMLYGPVVGGLVGMIGDLIEYVIRPSGAFFFGFTLNKFVLGFWYGLMLYKKDLSWKRVILAVFVGNLLTDVVLTQIWLNMMYGTQLFTVVRVIKCAVMFPINTAMLYFILKVVKSARLTNRDM